MRMSVQSQLQDIEMVKSDLSQWKRQLFLHEETSEDSGWGSGSSHASSDCNTTFGETEPDDITVDDILAAFPADSTLTSGDDGIMPSNLDDDYPVPCPMFVLPVGSVGCSDNASVSDLGLGDYDILTDADFMLQ